MEINHLFAQEHIRKWANAWNHHDLKKILSFYSEDILFSSPKVKLVFPDRPSATITDKRELGEYFSRGLKKFPKYIFDNRAFCGETSINILNAKMQTMWPNQSFYPL